MGQGISEVLTYAVGVAITVSAIIAVILMLFSQRARVNGPLFLLGWVVALHGQRRDLCHLRPEQRLDQQQCFGHHLVAEDRVRRALPAPRFAPIP